MLYVLCVISLLPATALGVCEFPAALRGSFQATYARWAAATITITNETISSLPIDNDNRDLTCYDFNNDTTYILSSENIAVGGSYYNFLTCLDIVPSADNSAMVFFHVRTNASAEINNAPFITKLANEDKTFETICQAAASVYPLQYEFFYKEDFASQESVSCPSALHAVFHVNMTDDEEYRKCPNGFMLDGCSLDSLIFNFTDCGTNETTGVNNYTCVSTFTGTTTYTTIYMPESTSDPADNPYRFACLEQTMVDDVLSVTKSAGVCGGTPAVDMMTNETASCRVPPTTTTVAPPTTTEGTNGTTQAPPTSTTPGNGTGGGGNGPVGSAITTAPMAFATILLCLAAIFCNGA